MTLPVSARPRRARWLHPVAWWAWALSLAVVASRTTNPLLLGLIMAVAAYVVAARRPAAPWGRAFGVFVRLGLLVLLIRVVVGILFGAPDGGTVLLRIPEIPLPDQLAGVRIGGDVTAPALLTMVYEGLRLMAILVCVGAANSLASPTRLLKSVPAALYEIGVAIIVAVSFAPTVAADTGRVRTARRLRGRRVRGMAGVQGVALPVLDNALDRSVRLAAAMDSRGYGRTAQVSPRVRHLTSGLLLLGLLAGAVAAYALLDARLPQAVAGLLLVVSIACSIAGLLLSGRRSVRTRYRRDPWVLEEWLVAGSGLLAAASAIAASAASGMAAPVDPPGWPTLPLAVSIALLLAITPAWTAPPPPDRALTAADTPHPMVKEVAA